VFGALFVIAWLRARFSPDSVTLSANLLIVFAYMLMAFVRQPELFFAVAALADVGWTLSASELWVAAQHAMPSRARGRMNATVIMISQGAMVVGGLIWSFAAAVAGPIYTLLGASVLFLASLLLARRLSINLRTDPARESLRLSIWKCRIRRGDANSARKRIGRSLNDSDKDYEERRSRKWSTDRTADSHGTCFQLGRGHESQLARWNQPGSCFREMHGRNYLATRPISRTAFRGRGLNVHFEYGRF